ncbi:membrane protein insertion efficiency factor YidD [Halomonas sp. SH5A2]|uniref:membrane protein insertion efficiency factor YidD n=1 Tax=Halomonas sp. SH5A2 TaxID=2749040 RepID=UPI00163E1479|nr:membrane protein insertion efficiency factor YidD [Halomonas sp. SH5A2]QNI03025.1 membrane protein insertion efficiency factor YidD [Halomonas sp. SH5A2]
MNPWRTLFNDVRWLVGQCLVVMVRIYQYTLSPLLGPRCRFWPSCSSYAIEAIQVHGPFKGSWMAVKRLMKCHPGSDGGMDPVPGGRSEDLCREDEENPHTDCHHHSQRD